MKWQRLRNIAHLGIKELRSLLRDPVMLVLIVYAFSFSIYTAATAIPETLRKADDEAAMDALAAFQEKATRYAAALKKQYRIVSITIGSNGVPPAPSERYAMIKAVADSMPVEAGESQIVVGVTGQIELLESAASSARP